MLLAGIVDEDVEATQLIHGLLDRAFAELLVANIAGERDRAATLLLDNLLCLRRVIVLAQIDNRDVRALTRKQGRYRAADAAVAAGDERDLASQPVGAFVTRLPVRLRFELAFVAGQL